MNGEAFVLSFCVTVAFFFKMTNHDHLINLSFSF